MCIQRNSTHSSQAVEGREILPGNVKPLHYDLTLEPVFDGFTFNGEETIEFAVIEKSNYISLNVLDIEIHEVKLNGIEVDTVTRDEDRQTTTLTFKDNFVEGSRISLYLKFTGELNDKMAGFYRSSYEENGVTKYLATTQMESTDCRRAFPCYDEPAAKAEFTIALICDKDLVALSNMDVKETELLGDNKKKVSFNKTPLMSTYLVAFIVGDLKYVETHEHRVPIKVYATPGSEHLGEYSAYIAAKTLDFFEKKFDIPYPLPKCDMVAIHDFSAGAMENFGLITYRTVDLLIDPKNTNATTKQRVTEVVMHELAHQWFGNLVTMDFWDGLWLNEGFATWMSWYACNSLYPEWKVWEGYVSETLQQALSLDALRASHPVEVEVKRTDEISQIFDAISYVKGSALLKMISRWIGEDVFIKGVSHYLKRHKWGNTKTSDLWASISEVSGKNVNEVMDIWTKHVGFPVVTVTEKHGEIKVTQNRFLATGDVKPEEDKLLYPIFLALRTSDGIDDSLLLNERSTSIKLPDDDFYKFNSEQAGIYRVAYESERWFKLGKAGENGKLSVEDRTGLVADAGSLAASGYISSADLLNLVKSWSNESNYVVWSEILNRISAIKAAMKYETTDIIKLLNRFIVNLVGPKLKSIGWEFTDKDTFAEENLKTRLFSAAASADHEEVVQYAKTAFSSFIKGDKSSINPNLRSSIFSTVAKTGDSTTFDQLFDIYRNSKSIEERMDALRALGSFTDADLLDKTLGLLLKADIIKPQDIYKPMISMRNRKVGTTKLWNWLVSKWDEIYEIFPPTSSMLGTMVTLSTTGFSTFEQKKEVEKFFGGKETKGYDQSLASSLDSITAKANWARNDATTIYEWLSTESSKL